MKHYTLRHGGNYKADALRNWDFQGSANGTDWEVLRSHRQDSSLQGPFAIATWEIPPSKRKIFNYFRVIQTGHNSSSHNFLVISNIEIYGELFERPDIYKDEINDDTLTADISENEDETNSANINNNSEKKEFAEPIKKPRLESSKSQLDLIQKSIDLVESTEENRVKQDRIVAVILPDGTKTLMFFTLESTFLELLVKTCRKRRWDHSKFTIVRQNKKLIDMSSNVHNNIRKNENLYIVSQSESKD